MSRNCSILIYTEWHIVWKHLLPHPSIPPSCQKHTRIPFLHALVLFFPLGNLAFLLPSIAVGTWDSTKHILTLSPDRAHPELSKVFKGHERPSWENVLFFSSFSFTPWSIFHTSEGFPALLRHPRHDLVKAVQGWLEPETRALVQKIGKCEFFTCLAAPAPLHVSDTSKKSRPFPTTPTVFSTIS